MSSDTLTASPGLPGSSQAVKEMLGMCATLGQLLRDRSPIARDSRLDDTVHVLIEQVAVCRELQCRCANLGPVIGLVPVALGERSARISSRCAGYLVRREPERKPVHWNDLLG